HDQDLAAGPDPAPSDLVDRARIGAAVVEFREYGQAFDAAQDREGGDRAGRAERPHRTPAELPARHRGLEAFRDDEALGHVRVGINHDGRIADRAEHSAVDLLAVRRQPCPMHRGDDTWVPDPAERRQHGWHANDVLRAVAPRAAGMEAHHLAGDVIRKAEPAAGEILFAQGSARVAALVPEIAGAGAALGVELRGLWLGSSPMRCRLAEPAEHIGAALAPVVTGMLVHDE